MQRTVAMPKLGMTMTEGVIVRWRVAAGDVVAKDDVLVEVETDKVELEVEAPFAGTVAQIVADEGRTVPVGEPILLIEMDAAAVSKGSAAGPSPLATAITPQPDGHTTSTDQTPHAREASVPSRTPVPATPAARRVANELGLDLSTVASAGTRTDHTAPVRVADVLAFAPVSGASGPAAAPAQPAQSVLTPLARKLADAHALTPEDLLPASAMAATPSAPPRRVGRRAVEEALASRESAAPVPTAVAAEHSLAEFVPLTSMRRTIAERTTHSFTTTPHIYLDIEVDMTQAEALRSTLSGAAARHGETAPSATALLVRVVAAALGRHPEINAGFVPAREGRPAGVQRWREIGVGVAVALPDGLLVPVLRNANHKSLREISDELDSLVQRAREGRLQPDELAFGSFTISNLGMYGIDTFHAVLNELQAAILAVGQVRRRPVVVPDGAGGETIIIRPVMKLSLSADHRVVDGAMGARFLATLRELLEEPGLLV